MLQARLWDPTASQQGAALPNSRGHISACCRQGWGRNGTMTKISIFTMSVSSHIATNFMLGFALREQLMILITGMQR